MDYKAAYLQEKRKNDSLRQLYGKLMQERDSLKEEIENLTDQIIDIQREYTICNDELHSAIRDLNMERVEYEKLKKKLLVMMKEMIHIRETIPNEE